MSKTIRISCPICGNKQIKKRMGAYNECAHCLSIYTSVVPSVWKIQRRINHWGKNFVKEGVIEPVSQSSQDRVAFLFAYNNNRKKAKKLIDIGCGNGNFLKCAKQVGYDIHGMDICIHIVKYIRSIGIPAYNSLKKVNKKFNIATCFDVIEHTTNPRLFLQDSKRIIKKGGLLMITTPNAGGISALILGRRWWVFGPNDHYVLFKPHSLQKLLQETGFVVLDIKTNTITQWFHLKNTILNKIANKIIYLSLFPFKDYLFKKLKGDNIQILAQLT